MTLFGGHHDGRPHTFIPIAHEHVPQWGPTKEVLGRGYTLPERLIDKVYVVRACQFCPAVWWQEYDPRDAIVADPEEVTVRYEVGEVGTSMIRER